MDLVESNIPLLAVRLENTENYLNLSLLQDARDITTELISNGLGSERGVRVFKLENKKYQVFASPVKREALVYWNYSLADS